MRYQFLVGTYKTEIQKVLRVWAMFEEEDTSRRAHATDKRGPRPSQQLWSHSLHLGLMQNNAPVIYAYLDSETLLEEEAVKKRKRPLPGQGDKPSSER